ncbi:MAG: SlyX family protein [Alphaproteobacteria bacterium]|nr:SlyX family protein [Alphaproteobacteria bacterium]
MAGRTETDIAALQEKAAHQERQIDELSDIVAEQERRIDVMRKEILALAERQRELADAVLARGPDDRPPPHY